MIFSLVERVRIIAIIKQEKWMLGNVLCYYTIYDFLLYCTIFHLSVPPLQPHLRKYICLKLPQVWLTPAFKQQFIIIIKIISTFFWCHFSFSFSLNFPSHFLISYEKQKKYFLAVERNWDFRKPSSDVISHFEHFIIWLLLNKKTHLSMRSLIKEQWKFPFLWRWWCWW